jgi:colanic acid/amylovoran biosynthesis glycosyltransferase
LRIAIIIESFPSLSETFISNQVKQLCLRDHKLFIFCNNVNKELFEKLFKDKHNIKVISFHKKHILPYLLVHPGVGLKILRSEGKLKQNIFRKFRVDYINRFSPDIIHFEFSGVAISYLEDIYELKGKKVVSCRGTAEKVKLLIYKERQDEFRKLLDVVDAVHCVSYDIRETILPYCKNPQKIFINYPSVDASFFKRKAEKEKENIPVILSVGRFTFQKGYLTGLLAINSLKNQGYSFQWTIVGSGHSYEEMIFEINALKLNDHVVLAGAKSNEEVKQLMERADIFFLSSVYEGIANVVLEAMSMEVPVVSTKCGGMEEVISHGENGLLADVYDDVSLSSCLATLLDNHELRKLLGKAGRKKVVEKFNLNKQIDIFERIYHQLSNCYPVKRDGITYNDSTEKADIRFPKFRQASQRLRIGVIVPQFPSYTETFFINKIIGLCERGHEVVVFCNVHNRDDLLEESYWLDNYKNLKVVALSFDKLVDAFFKSIFLNPFILFRNISVKKKKFLNNLYYELCKLYLKKYHCDVYHFGYSGLALSYLHILKGLAGKVVVSCLGTAENIKPLTEPGRIEKLKILFDTVDRIHCVSEKMAETVKQYGADCKKIFINRPAVDVQLFSRSRAYTACGHVKIISVGRLVFQKGFLMGILAVAELKKQFDNFTWIIVGDGPEREQLLFHINELGLNNHVQLVGKKLREEVIQYYEESDILLLPSVSEGIANVILEGMAMELPVVASTNGGIEEVIKHNENGILVPNYDYRLMGCRLYDLCRDFKMRKQLGQEGRKTVASNFALKRYIDVFEGEYLKLVEK